MFTIAGAPIEDAQLVHHPHMLFAFGAAELRHLNPLAIDHPREPIGEHLQDIAGGHQQEGWRHRDLDQPPDLPDVEIRDEHGCGFPRVDCTGRL